jgi:hypothetical protein
MQAAAKDPWLSVYPARGPGGACRSQSKESEIWLLMSHLDNNEVYEFVVEY